MEPLTFLYISLGVGFLILVAFLCTMLFYVIRILRNASEVSEKVKDTANRINSYVIEPFSIVRDFYENIKPIINVIHDRKEDIEDTVKNVIYRKKKNKRDRGED